jgi:D-alanyl-D-alanine carboxypeptidase
MKKATLVGISLLATLIFPATSEFGFGIEKSAAASGAAALEDIRINREYSKAPAVRAVMEKYVKAGLPGVAVAVHTEKEGWWADTAGFSRVEDKTPMRPEHMHYLQSVAKTFMATVILQLAENGKLGLNDPVSRYLPAWAAECLSNPADITVRMLLNHTSGVPEYVARPEYVSRVILHPLELLSVRENLGYIRNEAPVFAPGSRYAYTNTDFEILSLVADAITGDHTVYMKKNIFDPLGMTQTRYLKSPADLDGLPVVDSYWDVLQTGLPANITPMQKANVASMKGDDGIVCAPLDAVKFICGLMEGKLLKPSSMELMKATVKNDKGDPIYGLGLSYLRAGGIEAWGHGGGGIGAGCVLLYIPAAKTGLFIATNLGLLLDSPLTRKMEPIKVDILSAVLQ